MLTIALIAVAAVWVGAVVVTVGLCASAARGDRDARAGSTVARAPSHRFLRTVTALSGRAWLAGRAR